MNMSEPSIVLLDANVITLNPRQLRAQAIAVQGGRIVDMGSDKQIRKHVCSGKKVIECEVKPSFQASLTVTCTCLTLVFSCKA